MPLWFVTRWWRSDGCERNTLSGRSVWVSPLHSNTSDPRVQRQSSIHPSCVCGGSACQFVLYELRLMDGMPSNPSPSGERICCSLVMSAFDSRAFRACFFICGLYHRKRFYDMCCYKNQFSLFLETGALTFLRRYGKIHTI